MQTILRRAPIVGALLTLCACAESTTAPATLDADTRPLELVVPDLAARETTGGAGRSGPQRTTEPLPPELEGESVPTEFLTAPGILGFDVVVGAGSGQVTAYAWMTYWATAGRISLTLNTMADAKPGFSGNSPAEDQHLFPGNYSLDDVLTLPFDYNCGAAASAQATFSAWHQFPTRLGALIRWGDRSAGKQANLMQEACVQEYQQHDGGSVRDDAVLPDVYDWYLCTYRLTYIGGVLVSVEQVRCVPVA
jgi:hypothetical protein